MMSLLLYWVTYEVKLTSFPVFYKEWDEVSQLSRLCRNSHAQVRMTFQTAFCLPINSGCTNIVPYCSILQRRWIWALQYKVKFRVCTHCIITSKALYIDILQSLYISSNRGHILINDNTENSFLIIIQNIVHHATLLLHCHCFFVSKISFWIHHADCILLVNMVAFLLHF